MFTAILLETFCRCLLTVLVFRSATGRKGEERQIAQTEDWWLTWRCTFVLQLWLSAVYCLLMRTAGLILTDWFLTSRWYSFRLNLPFPGAQKMLYSVLSSRFVAWHSFSFQIKFFNTSTFYRLCKHIALNNNTQLIALYDLYYRLWFVIYGIIFTLLLVPSTLSDDGKYIIILITIAVLDN